LPRPQAAGAVKTSTIRAADSISALATMSHGFEYPAASNTN
jgi:hypothetical protein